MENILKLSLKKDICVNLNSGIYDRIYFEAKPYWIRRFSNNPESTIEQLNETQDFKVFDKIEINCAGETFVYDFGCIKTGYPLDDCEKPELGICVYIKNSNDTEQVNEVTDLVSDNYESKEIKVEIPSINDTENVNTLDDSEYSEQSNEDITSNDTQEDCECEDECNDVNNEDEDCFEDDIYKSFYDEKKTLLENIIETIDIIGGFDNVAIVGVPKIIITSNGHIFGTKQYISNMRNDSEIRFSIGVQYIPYDEKEETPSQFSYKVTTYLTDLVNNKNFVLIWKNGCKMVTDKSGNKYFALRVSIVKRY